MFEYFLTRQITIFFAHLSCELYYDGCVVCLFDCLFFCCCFFFVVFFFVLLCVFFFFFFVFFFFLFFFCFFLVCLVFFGGFFFFVFFFFVFCCCCLFVVVDFVVVVVFNRPFLQTLSNACLKLMNAQINLALLPLVIPNKPYRINKLSVVENPSRNPPLRPPAPPPFPRPLTPSTPSHPAPNKIITVRSLETTFFKLSKMHSFALKSY